MRQCASARAGTEADGRAFASASDGSDDGAKGGSSTAVFGRTLIGADAGFAALLNGLGAHFVETTIDGNRREVDDQVG